MDIRNIGNRGNADRIADRGERGRRTEPRRSDAPVAGGGDDARISDAGRETAVAVEQLAERARTGDGEDREARVAEARRKLEGGELDQPHVLAATAQRLSARGLLGA